MADMAAFRFRPGIGLSICAFLGFVLLLALGTWQVQRLRWKTALIATVEARAAQSPVPLATALSDPLTADLRSVTVAGEYRHDLAFAMGAVGAGGEIGARLVTPMALANGELLLVERGWLPERLLPPLTPPTIQPQGVLPVAGRLRDQREARQGPFTPDNLPAERRWYWYDVPTLRRFLGAPIVPFVLVLEESDTGADLPRPLPARLALPNNHLGYAVTWYGLAAALAAVYVAYGLHRNEG
jgi:surfeit locus 1 family protein